MSKVKKVAQISEQRQKRAEIREGEPAHLTYRELRDMLNFGDPRSPDSNPYTKLGSSRQISPRLMMKTLELVPKIVGSREILEKFRTELLEKHSHKGNSGRPVMIPNEIVVEQRIVEHFNRLAEKDKTNNVARLIEREQLDKVRKEIEANLPLKFKRYDIIDMQAFEDDFEEALDQLVDLGGMKKIVVTNGDLPDYKFLNAFERNILGGLFEFDDLND